MNIRTWFHHLIDPHCSHCNLQRDQELLIQERIKACKSCENLTIQLEHERAERNRLLEIVLERSNPVINQAVEPVVPVTEFKPISPGIRSWPSMRAKLERDSAIAAEKLKEARTREVDPVIKTEIEELENELGVKDA